MKLERREIYEIGKKLLSQSSFALENFLNNDELAAIRENPYIVVRDADELVAFFLFDFKAYEDSAKKFLKGLLGEIDCRQEIYDYLIRLFRASYVSLFRIEEKDDHFLFYDILLDEYIEVDNYTGFDIGEDKFGLFRIFGEGERKTILQIIQIMDKEVFFSFSDNLENFISHMEENYGPTKFDRDLLKSEFLNILAIFGATLEYVNNRLLRPTYFETRDEARDFEDLIDKFNQEDLFVLQNRDLFKKIIPGGEIEFIMAFFTNLFTKIYSNFLFEKEKTFKSYDLDYKEIFRDLCESGDFLNRQDLSSSLDFLIIFYGGLLTRGRPVKKILGDLNEVKENIFYYLDLLKKSEEGFYFDDDIFSILQKNKNFVLGNKFIENFDSFLTFLDMNYVNKLKSGDLSPSMLKKFTNLIHLKPISEVQTLKNKHFPLIELFYNFLVKKYLTLITVEDGPEELYLTEYADNYSSYNEFTKLSIWTEALTNRNFLKSAFGKNYTKYVGFVIDFLRDLYNRGSIKYGDFSNQESALLNILDDLGLIEQRKYSKEIKLTKFGEDIYNYYKTEKTNSDNIIKVDFK